MSTTQAPSSQRITRRTLAPKQKRGHKRGTSEVGKFLHSLLRQEDTPKKKSGKKFHSLRLDSPTRELDAEALTSEERLSRLLHTPKPKIKLPEFGSLYDHFVVVGVPDHLAKSPKILFKFPPDSPVEIPGLPDFCFPGGIISSELPDSVCKSEMIGLLHNQQYLKQPKNSFVFLFTNQESQVYYGICVHKEEILEEPPQYMKDIFVPPSIRSTTTRCYCIITRFPFFRFHFEFLFSLFAVEHVTRLERSAPSILEEKEELDVFLSPSKSRVINQLSSDSISRSQTFPDKRRRNTNEVTSIKLDFEDLPKNIDEPQPEELPSPLLDELVTPRDGESTANNPIKRKEKKNRSCCLRKSSPGVLTQHITQTDKVVVQKIDHPCIKAMRSYRELPIPTKGQEIIFSASDYLSPFSFRRPFFDEEEELFAEWGLPVTLHMLSFETLCEFLSAILLEKKVLVYAESLRILSALVFAFPPLIKPFTYQSVIIPMLPDKMESFLEAPVPFVVGTTRDPSSPELEIPDDVVILNAAKNQLISGEPIAGLPQYDELNRKCSPFVQELLASFAGETPYSTTQVQRQLINSICTVFETHFDSLFANFHNYTICNKSDPSKPISVFMKDSFLDDIEEEELPFLEPFVASQAFFEYSDQRLRKRDNGE